METKSAMKSKLTYFADDKFLCVIEALNNRRYSRVENVAESFVLWTNLKSLNYGQCDMHTLVNHFKGSQHFSNKAYLTYHLLASHSCLSALPLTWSPAIHDATDLLVMLLESALHELQYQLYASIILLTDAKLLLKRYKELYIFLQQFDHSPSKLCQPFLSSIQHHLQAVQRSISNPSNIESINRNANIWILKPVGLSCGEHITLSHSLLPTLQAVVHAYHHKCIVQKYIECPLLLTSKKCKFDIRQWVLISSLQPLAVYGFSEAYIRLAGQSFTLDNAQLNNKFTHLCNHAIQKEYISPIEEEEGGEGGGETRKGCQDARGAGWQVEGTSETCPTMMTQSSFAQELAEHVRRHNIPCKSSSDAFQELIFPQIQQIALDSLQSCRDMIHDPHHNGFEWLGYDLMVDEQCKVYLIEINTSPDISYSTSVTTPLVQDAVRDGLNLLLDELPSRKHTKTIARIDDLRISSIAGERRWRCWYAEGHSVQPLNDDRKSVKARPYDALSWRRSKRSVAVLKKDYALHDASLLLAAIEILQGEGGRAATGGGGRGERGKAGAAAADDDDDDEI
jgi:hypothetical protein